MSEMVTLENPATGGVTRVPDDPAVLEHLVARGWERAERQDDPAAGSDPVVPGADGGQPQPHPASLERARKLVEHLVDADQVDVDDVTGQAWAELVHPDTGARARFPADEAVLAAQVDQGWVKPNRDGSVPAQARKAAERRAERREHEQHQQHEQHDDEQPAATAAGDHEPGTAGADSKES